MSMQKWSEDVILVELLPEPHVVKELQEVIHAVRDCGDCDVVIDFSRVDILISDSLAQLVRLQKLLTDCQHKLTFCNVDTATKGIFTVTGLEGVFNMVDDRFGALAVAQESN